MSNVWKSPIHKPYSHMNFVKLENRRLIPSYLRGVVSPDIATMCLGLDALEQTSIRTGIVGWSTTKAKNKVKTTWRMRVECDAKRLNRFTTQITYGGNRLKLYLDGSTSYTDYYSPARLSSLLLLVWFLRIWRMLICSQMKQLFTSQSIPIKNLT